MRMLNDTDKKQLEIIVKLINDRLLEKKTLYVGPMSQYFMIKHTFEKYDVKPIQIIKFEIDHVIGGYNILFYYNIPLIDSKTIPTDCAIHCVIVHIEGRLLNDQNR